jgi:hypothetical protein
MAAGLAVVPAAAGGDATNLLVNGSFEFWSHLGRERLQDALKNGPAFDGEDPLIPTRWTWRLGRPMGFRRSEAAHAGRLAEEPGRRRDAGGRRGATRGRGVARRTRRGAGAAYRPAL